MKFRLVVPGMMCPLGWANEFHLRGGLVAHPYRDSDMAVEWSAVHMPNVRLSHPVHLMVIEGAAPAWLFLGARVQGVEQRDLEVHGPFILLQLSWSALHTVPFELKDVVLGVPQTIPSGLKLTDLLPAMISSLPTLS